MVRYRRWLVWFFATCFVCFLLGSLAIAGVYSAMTAKLPDISSLRQFDWQEPLYVYANDGQLMAVYGETRRYPVQISEVPQKLKSAFLATEDARFYEHGGVDYKGIARAIWLLATTKAQRVPGGSTITQQVARQFFLSSDYSYRRKLAEILLARKIESQLSKDQIFELYLNKSFFGNRSYGIRAAAEYYYGKELTALTLDEMASLAGIPKFPSSGNPVSNPERARQRRDNYVLQRMADLGFVSQAEADQAKKIPMHAAPHEPPVQIDAPYVSEMVRQEMIARYGGDVLNKGYRVYTSIDPHLQLAAQRAVQNGLLLYDHRHGWHGPEQHLDFAADATITSAAHRIANIPTEADLVPALVWSKYPNGSIQVILADQQEVTLPPSSAQWIGKLPSQILQRGDLIRIRRLPEDHRWMIDQMPHAQAALISMDTKTGALRAIIGGFSFATNKFNRAVQARRQPGSTFKPFIYAAAFAKGFNPGSIVLDTPVLFREQQGGRTWSPQNDDERYLGPTLLRDALVQSRNLVSIRLLDTIGVDFARDRIAKFGFEEADLPRNLSLALGAPSLTPLSLARGYAAFVNGGFRITPWMIDRVQDRDGNTIFQANPAIACRACQPNTTPTAEPVSDSQIVDGFNFGEQKPVVATSQPATPMTNHAADPAQNQNQPAAPRAVDERIAFQIASMMHDVVIHGTGSQARVIARPDIGGKTGSTNEFRDAWFSGFGGPYITTVWVGRDDFQSLGNHEYGGKAALPIWISYMQSALINQPNLILSPPPGMTQATFNGVTEWVKDEDLDHLQDHDYKQDQEPADEEKAFDIF